MERATDTKEFHSFSVEQSHRRVEVECLLKKWLRIIGVKQMSRSSKATSAVIEAKKPSCLTMNLPGLKKRMYSQNPVHKWWLYSFAVLIGQGVGTNRHCHSKLNGAKPILQLANFCKVCMMALIHHAGNVVLHLDAISTFLSKQDVRSLYSQPLCYLYWLHDKAAQFISIKSLQWKLSSPQREFLSVINNIICQISHYST